MPTPKIDKAELNSMLRSGKSQKECAEFFGVSESAISMAKKVLKTSIVRTVVLDKANEIIESDLNLMVRLRFIMETILEELENVKKELREGDGSKAQLRESLIALTAENRKQLNLLKEIAESWYDHRIANEFREEVLSVLESFEEGTREKVLTALKQKQALRGAISIN